jgi:hypothetical protein
MTSASIEAMREICDVLDTLILAAKLDHAPVRAISLLERARADMQTCVDKFDMDDQVSPEIGLKAKGK